MRRLFVTLALSLLVGGLATESPTLASKNIWKPVGRVVRGTNTDDYFGWDVDIDDAGDTIAVGAPFAGGTTGEIRVYDLDPSTHSWVLRGSPIGGFDGEIVGFAIDLSADGGTVAFASPFNGGCLSLGEECDESLSRGLVRVFDWIPGTGWVQRGADMVGDPGSLFGWSIALSDGGSTIVVGSAALWAGDGTSNRVQVFDWVPGTGWLQRGDDFLGATDIAPGWSVAISDDGDTIGYSVIVGVGSGAEGSGLIEVFDWNGSTWVEADSITADGPPSAEAIFPMSLSMSDDGNTVAFFNTVVYGALDSTSYALVFDRADSSSEWTQRGAGVKAHPLDLELLGGGLSLSGDGSTLVLTDSNINAVNIEDLDSASADGSVRIIDWTGEAWVQRGTKISTAGEGSLPYSVAISADNQRVVVGAFSDFMFSGPVSGVARVYEWGAPQPMSRISVTFDPAGGTCDGKTTQWTVAKRGTITLPTAEQCARPGYVLLGWTNNPTNTAPEELLHTVVGRPTNLTAVWGVVPPAPTALTLISNFLCDNCGSTLVAWQQSVGDITRFEIAIDNTVVDCPAIAWGEWWVCGISSFDSAVPHAITVRALNRNGAGPPATVISS